MLNQYTNWIFIAAPDLSKRKGLPSWLREELEKIEKEKQKKSGKGKSKEEPVLPPANAISGYQHKVGASPSASPKAAPKEDDSDKVGLEDIFLFYVCNTI